MRDSEHDGRKAYQAYAGHTSGKTYDGRDMPAWDDLGDRIQGAWMAAARSVANGECPCLTQTDATGAVCINEPCEEHS